MNNDYHKIAKILHDGLSSSNPLKVAQSKIVYNSLEPKLIAEFPDLSPANEDLDEMLGNVKDVLKWVGEKTKKLTKAITTTLNKAYKHINTTTKDLDKLMGQMVAKITTTESIDERVIKAKQCDMFNIGSSIMRPRHITKRTGQLMTVLNNTKSISKDLEKLLPIAAEDGAEGLRGVLSLLKQAKFAPLTTHMKDDLGKLWKLWNMGGDGVIGRRIEYGNTILVVHTTRHKTKLKQADLHKTNFNPTSIVEVKKVSKELVRHFGTLLKHQKDRGNFPKFIDATAKASNKLGDNGSDDVIGLIYQLYFMFNYDLYLLTVDAIRNGCKLILRGL